MADIKCPYCYSKIAMGTITLDIQERMVRLAYSLSGVAVERFDAKEEAANIVALLEGRSIEGLDDDEPSEQKLLFEEPRDGDNEVENKLGQSD